jgi:MFS superfamily sulfate permease-like transporter
MHLGLGPVALVSILTGQLVTQYGITPGTQDAVDFTGEAALAVGVLFTVLSIFNMGDLVHFVSHPVMVRCIDSDECVHTYNAIYIFVCMYVCMYVIPCVL